MNMDLDLVRIQTESRQQESVADETTRRRGGTSGKNQSHSHGILITLPTHHTFTHLFQDIHHRSRHTEAGDRDAEEGFRIESKSCSLDCHGALSVRLRCWIRK
jgi:hypothetical protein